MKTNTETNGGTSVLGLLGIAFVVLKLTGYIDWSWWWVTAPLWGGIVVALVFVALMFLVSVVVVTWRSRRGRR